MGGSGKEMLTGGTGVPHCSAVPSAGPKPGLVVLQRAPGWAQFTLDRKEKEQRSGFARLQMGLFMLPSWAPVLCFWIWISYQDHKDKSKSRFVFGWANKKASRAVPFKIPTRSKCLISLALFGLRHNPSYLSMVVDTYWNKNAWSNLSEGHSDLTA